MVREIIALQIGQCGNQVGSVAWRSIFMEHGLNEEGECTMGEHDKMTPNPSYTKEVATAGANVYFSEATSKKKVPRAVICDLEPGTIDVIKASPIGPAFLPDNMIFGLNGAGNNWAKGHYTEGAELIEEVLDKVRREIEKCAAPQGFQFTHSLGGGTGSGMGTLLILKIRDAYPDKITKTYSIYPSPKVSDTVVEPYNAVLSSHQLLENSDETFIIDNEALYNISANILKLDDPTYSELNELVSRVICGITSSLRFPGQLNGDLRKLGVNLVPFPRLHFFLMSIAPIGSVENLNKTKIDIKACTTQATSNGNSYANVDFADGKILACALVYRDLELKSQDIDKATKDYQEKNSEGFVEWIPNNTKSSLISAPEIGYKLSATFCANTTSLKQIYQRIATQFGAMYRRKAFLHWYKGEGMDEMEFQEADKNVRDLITEYQDKQDAVIEDEEENSDEDDDNL